MVKKYGVLVQGDSKGNIVADNISEGTFHAGVSAPADSSTTITGNKAIGEFVHGVEVTPSGNKQDAKHSDDHWYKKPPGVIAVAVVAGLLLWGIRLAVHHFTGAPL